MKQRMKNHIKKLTPPFKYHGTKARTAKKYIEEMPPHKGYFELFGGSFSVGFQKPAAATEIYNDTNSEIVNCFEVIRSDWEKLSWLLRFTPYSRDEYYRSFQKTDNKIEAARRFIVRTSMSISSTQKDVSGFRSGLNKDDYCGHAFSFAQVSAKIEAIAKRLERVIIENKSFEFLIEKKCYDLPAMFWFIDPPYLKTERGNKSNAYGYANDMSIEQHVFLLEKCKNLSGKVMICGYESHLYNSILRGWTKKTFKGFSDNAKSTRQEVIWMNYSHNLFTQNQ